MENEGRIEYTLTSSVLMLYMLILWNRSCLFLNIILLPVGDCTDGRRIVLSY